MTDMLRVAMVIQAYYPRLGGAERQLSSLAPLLKNLNVEIQIFTRRYDRTLLPFEIINEVPVHRLPVPGPKPLAAMSFSLSAMPVLRKFKPDVIHAHELLSPATTAIMAKRIFRIPVIAKVLRGGELGDLAKLKKSTFGSNRIESIKRDIDTFVVISTEIDRELAEIGVPREKRVFIPNGVDLTRFTPLNLDQKLTLRKKLHLPDGLIVVFSGRLDVEKRVDHLVALWPSILSRCPEAFLLILGSGSEEQRLKTMAERNIIFAGNIQDVAPFLSASDIFVLPSSTEGLSNSLLEAMASGLPSIATEVGGASDLISQGENGILVQPGDKTELGTAILDLLNNGALRLKFGEKGRAVIEQKYALPAVAMKLRSLYQRMIA